jgi:hypothetical protein
MGTTWCDVSSDYVTINGYRISVILIGQRWYYSYYGIYNCDVNYTNDQDFSSVAQTTNGYIPTTGWSPDIIITPLN